MKWLSTRWDPDEDLKKYNVPAILAIYQEYDIEANQQAAQIFEDTDSMTLLQFHKSVSGAAKKQTRVTGKGYDILLAKIKEIVGEGTELAAEYDRVTQRALEIENDPFRVSQFFESKEFQNMHVALILSALNVSDTVHCAIAPGGGKTTILLLLMDIVRTRYKLPKVWICTHNDMLVKQFKQSAA